MSGKWLILKLNTFSLLPKILDCECEAKGIFGTKGCIIDPEHPPPYGHKCLCKHYVFGCEGSNLKCMQPTDFGGSGCARKECCSEDSWRGDCNGYDNI